MGNNTTAALIISQVKDGIGGTPELEGSYLLEILTLEKQLRTTDGIKLMRGQDRSPVHMTADSIAGCRDI